jgi:hypothetical protein
VTPAARQPFVRLAVRFPVLTRIGIRAVIALPASRLRIRLWTWAMRLGFSSSDRRDWDFIRTFLDPAARVDLDRAGGWRLGFDSQYRGPDGYIRWFETLTEAFEHWNTSDIEVIAPAGTRVLVVVRPRGQGAGSGLPVSGELWAVFSYERGWLTRIQAFADSDEALAAVGLRRHAATAS